MNAISTFWPTVVQQIPTNGPIPGTLESSAAGMLQIFSKTSKAPLLQAWVSTEATCTDHSGIRTIARAVAQTISTGPLPSMQHAAIIGLNRGTATTPPFCSKMAKNIIRRGNFGQPAGLSDTIRSVRSE
ncbi:MAG: hypothetical protein R3C59_23930 [Planctomycetaceae bacterium]